MSTREKVGIALVGLVVLVMAAPRWGLAQSPRETPLDSTCPGDFDRDGQVTVDEIIRAVNMAQDGCPGCADISGVWVLKYIGNGDGNCPKSATYDMTIGQADNCTFDGSTTDAAGNLTIIRNGTVANESVSFESLAVYPSATSSPSHKGTALSDGRTMGGIVTYTFGQNPHAGVCTYNWSATRAVEGTPAAR